eukprot:1162036-Pelagomonas_calceolata.AAC.17
MKDDGRGQEEMGWFTEMRLQPPGSPAGSSTESNGTVAWNATMQIQGDCADARGSEAHCLHMTVIW